jgi:hypothetical protein
MNHDQSMFYQSSTDLKASLLVTAAFNCPCLGYSAKMDFGRYLCPARSTGFGGRIQLRYFWGWPRVPKLAGLGLASENWHPGRVTRQTIRTEYPVRRWVIRNQISSRHSIHPTSSRCNVQRGQTNSTVQIDFPLPSIEALSISARILLLLSPYNGRQAGS